MTTRLAAIVAAVLAGLLVAGLIIGWNLRPSPPRPAPAPPAERTEAATASYTPDATDAGTGENHADGPAEVQEALWGPVVDNFAHNFTNTDGGAAKWRQRLIGDPAKPYVTTEVAEQLATVAMRRVPHGHYISREVLKSSEHEIAVKVDYRAKARWAMVLYLITDGTHWQIYAYDKWED